MTNGHFLEAMSRLQKAAGTVAEVPSPASRVGFSFSSKDRMEFTRATLASVDTESGFDVVWVDGSESAEAKQLPYQYPWQKARLVEVHSGVSGGPDRAICFGLRRLLALGYDYCGLIENDLLLAPGWFSRLLALFRLAAEDGIACGAATVRGYQSRVMAYRGGYFLSWNIGAGMVLFSRPAAQLLLAQYHALGCTARSLFRFYGDAFGIDLRGQWDLWYGAPDHLLAMDWGYSPLLYRHGLASVGSIPSLVCDLEFDVGCVLRTAYVGPEAENAGAVYPAIPPSALRWSALSEPLFRLGWCLLQNWPPLYRAARYLHHSRQRRRARSA
ncbi:MAG TPA: hypothetical protein VKT29_03745 [Terriglobales bacterium]|nr:hypothetical protein [Terriglobales bacterium]